MPEVRIDVRRSPFIVINNWAVMKFPYPGALTALQYFSSATTVLTCGRLGIVDHDRLDLLTMWRFHPDAIIFYLALFTNSELLLHANVGTFIVFRSVVPFFVAMGETLFLSHKRTGINFLVMYKLFRFLEIRQSWMQNLNRNPKSDARICNGSGSVR